jgi:branched-chain amino acid transport system substrate-binding protein
VSARIALALAAVGLAIVASACGGRGASAIRIGVLADCEGPFSFGQGSSYAGAELPLIRRGARPLGSQPANGISEVAVAGRKVQLLFGCGDFTAEKTLTEARRLVEQDGVQIVIGPLVVGESLVVRDYAHRRPGTTFVDGIAAGQALTLDDPAANFLSFTPDGAQQSAGLGWYAYRKLGWRRAVTVAVDEAYEYSQVAGFVAEFCALGGTIVKRLWSPQWDISADVTHNRADGFFVEDPANFTTEFKNLKGSLAKRVVGGGFSTNSDEAAKRLGGVVHGAPTPPSGKPTRLIRRKYLTAYHKAFPALAVGEPTIFTIGYFDAMTAVLTALAQVHGDLSGGERRFQAALAKVRLDSPVGPIRLDHNRQAIAPNYLLRVQSDGSDRTIRVLPNVDQTFGGYFHSNGPQPGRTYPACRHGHPPPWARSG